MSTSVSAADWIKRIADDERKRDAARAREELRALLDRAPRQIPIRPRSRRLPR